MKTDVPQISILLPVYNCSDLKPTLDSVLNQTYKNFELLICDDGSSKDKLDLDFKDARIKTFRNQKNIGLGATLNKLLRLSHRGSRYFSTIEQDDIYKPEFLANCISFLNNHPDYGLVSGISEFWDGDKTTYRFPGLISQGYDYPFGRKMFLLNYKEQIKVPQTSMLVRKNIHIDHKLAFSTKYHSLSVDWDYILRFSLVSKIKGLNKTFVIQDRRRDRSSLTTKSILVSKTARRLIFDFYNEFPNLISKKDYKYALATQLYRELGNYYFLARLKFIFFNIILLDPDKKRLVNRIKKEIKKLSRIIKR